MIRVLSRTHASGDWRAFRPSICHNHVVVPIRSFQASLRLALNLLPQVGATSTPQLIQNVAADQQALNGMYTPYRSCSSRRQT